MSSCLGLLMLIFGLLISRDPNLRPSFAQLTTALKTVQRLVSPSPTETQGPPVPQEIWVNSTPWQTRRYRGIRSLPRPANVSALCMDWAPQPRCGRHVLLPWQRSSNSHRVFTYRRVAHEATVGRREETRFVFPVARDNRVRALLREASGSVKLVLCISGCAY